jgi:hypothetical protein
VPHARNAPRRSAGVGHHTLSISVLMVTGWARVSNTGHFPFTMCCWSSVALLGICLSRERRGPSRDRCQAMIIVVMVLR